MSLSKVAASKANEQIILSKDREIRKLRDEVARIERQNKHLHEQIEIEEKKAAFRVAIDNRDYVARVLEMLKKSKGISTAVLIFNDWHAGEEIKLDQVNGLNEYNLDICPRRAKRVAVKSVEWLDRGRSQARIDDMVLALLGDFISGAIHPELLESDLLSPSQSTMFVQEILIDIIHFLLKETKVKNLIVPCCPGNHGRTTAKRVVSTYADNSFEFMMYQNLAGYFRKESKVKFVLTKSYHNYIDIHGQRVRFHHGDGTNYWGGVGGPTIPINKSIAAWNKVKNADLDYFGHLHTYIDTLRWTLCPSLIGHSPFGIAVKADYCPPAQIFSIINQKHGKVCSEMLYAE
jgi:hypothetical protein